MIVVGSGRLKAGNTFILKNILKNILKKSPQNSQNIPTFEPKILSKYWSFFFFSFLWSSPWLDISNEPNYGVVSLFIGEVRSAPHDGLCL